MGSQAYRDIRAYQVSVWRGREDKPCHNRSPRIFHSKKQKEASNNEKAFTYDRGAWAALDASARTVLGSRQRIYRRLSSSRILPRIRRASMHVVNLRRLCRLARSWWETCAGSSQRTKSGTMKAMIKTFLALAFAAKTAKCSWEAKRDAWRRDIQAARARSQYR
jgi:hypothetical protein